MKNSGPTASIADVAWVHRTTELLPDVTIRRIDGQYVDGGRHYSLSFIIVLSVPPSITKISHFRFFTTQTFKHESPPRHTLLLRPLLSLYHPHLYSYRTPCSLTWSYSPSNTNTPPPTISKKQIIAHLQRRTLGRSKSERDRRICTCGMHVGTV
ncbi:hypothetical protein BJ165DRAFT_330297 [Panaeolus papilionaceus]|nr:hypothetical protein BJ165DRAFT_330297 [Panaeolus papilionaceus]